MKEEFLHFLWKYRLLNTLDLKTTHKEEIMVLSVGRHNHNAGPDFIESKIRIGKQIWIGQVEIHVKASDWLSHGHQHDPAYDQVILHVVLENDANITLPNGTELPVLELKNIVDLKLYDKFNSIQNSKKVIGCGVTASDFEDFHWESYLDRLLVERLARKTEKIQWITELKTQDWEEVLYIFLARTFGSHVNMDAFENLASITPLNLVLNYRESWFQLEALFYGQAGLLDEDFQDKYPILLRNEYDYLRRKHTLIPMNKGLWKYLRMMPSGFPSIRISQFAHLFYQGHIKLFSSLLEVSSYKDIIHVFNLRASDYWQDHSQFDLASKKKIKKTGISFQRNIVVNALVPMLFFYGRKMKIQDHVDKSISWMYELKPEQNKITKAWKSIGFELKSAAQSQASIELFNEYCSQKKCLNCRIGLKLIK